MSSLERAISWSVLGRTAGVAFTAVAVILLTRLLGPDQFGQMSWVISMTSLLIIAVDLGMSSSVARFMSADPPAARQLFRRYLWVASAALGATVLAIGIWAAPVGNMLGSPWLGSLRWAMALLLVAQFSHRILSKGYEALKLVEVHSKIGLVSQWWPWALAVVAVAVGGGVREAIGGQAVGLGLAVIWLAVVLRRKFPAASPDSVAPPLSRVFAYAVPLVFVSASHYVYTHSDIMLLQGLGDERQVGLYSAAVRLVDMLHVPAVALGSAVAAYFVGDDTQHDVLFGEITRLLLIVYLGAAVGLAFLASSIVGLLFGPEFSDSATIILLYLPFVVAKGLAVTYALALDYRGKAYRRSLVVGFSAVANVALNVLLIPSLGMEGAAIATQLTYVPVVAWYGIELGRASGIRSIDLYRSLKPVFGSLLLLAAVLAIAGLVNVPALGAAVLGGGAYLGALAALGVFSEAKRALGGILS